MRSTIDRVTKSGGLSQYQQRASFGLKFLLILSFASAMLLGACSVGAGAASSTPDPAGQASQLQTATPEPTATIVRTPRPTARPTPAPTPVALKGQPEAHSLVWAKVRECANQLADATEAGLAVSFATDYDPSEGSWQVQAFSREPSFTLGTWDVIVSSGDVTARDTVAQSIDTPGLQCVPPGAVLAAGSTPPIFAAPAPTPTPVPTPVPVPPPPTLAVLDAEQAATSVWADVYSCYDHFPEVASFTARPDGPTRWIVEGRGNSGTATVYGLWSVEALSGTITPIDALALRAKESCVPSAVVLTPEQAALRVWLATYQCFTPRPEFGSFTGYQDNPQRWIVEGRLVDGNTTTLYGLWLVDTETGRVQPWDQLASSKAGQSCIGRP